MDKKISSSASGIKQKLSPVKIAQETPVKKQKKMSECDTPKRLGLSEIDSQSHYGGGSYGEIKGAHSQNNSTYSHDKVVKIPHYDEASYLSKSKDIESSIENTDKELVFEYLIGKTLQSLSTASNPILSVFPESITYSQQQFPNKILFSMPKLEATEIFGVPDDPHQKLEFYNLPKGIKQEDAKKLFQELIVNTEKQIIDGIIPQDDCRTNPSNTLWNEQKDTLLSCDHGMWDIRKSENAHDTTKAYKEFLAVVEKEITALREINPTENQYIIEIMEEIKGTSIKTTTQTLRETLFDEPSI